jgi:ribosomal protein L37AE/L43A
MEKKLNILGETINQLGEKIALHYCKSCKENKPVEEFSKRHRGSQVGYRPLNQCKNCRSNPAKQLSNLKKIYNKPNDQYECPLCARKKNIVGYNGAFVLDHNHETGQARGWICHDCNNALARTGENPNVLQKMIEYLTIENREKYFPIEANFKHILKTK